MFIRACAVAALTFSLSSVVFADPRDDAQAHFKAIAGGEVNTLMKEYSDHAVLEWVGGPLDGRYSGADKIRGLWAKFAQSQGTLTYTAEKVEESANPKGATVTANVEFKGKAPIKVRYVLVYREGKLVNEIWQIDPKLTISY